MNLDSTPPKKWVALTAPTPIPCPFTIKLLALPNEVITQIAAQCLERSAKKNDELPTKGTITRFHAKQKLELGLKDYLERLRVYTPFTRDTLLLSLLYLDRISRLPLDPPLGLEENLKSQPVFSGLTTLDDGVRRGGVAEEERGEGHSEEMEREGEGEDLIPLIPIPPLSPPDSPTSPSSSHPSSPSSSHQPSSSPPPAPPAPPPSSSSPPPPLLSPPLPSPTPLLNSYTLHRLLCSSLLISSKFTSDGTIPQSRAAKVAGVERGELGRLEVELLKALGWELGWKVEEVEGVCKGLLERGRGMGLVGCGGEGEEEGGKREEKEEEGEGVNELVKGLKLDNRLEREISETTGKQEGVLVS